MSGNYSDVTSNKTFINVSSECQYCVFRVSSTDYTIDMSLVYHPWVIKLASNTAELMITHIKVVHQSRLLHPFLCKTYNQCCAFLCCLRKDALTLCRFAGKYEGLVSESVPQVSYAFLSTSYLDDLAYAAAWLHKATGESALCPA